MRTYDYPKRRYELLVNVILKGVGGVDKVVLNPAAFSISDVQTDRWKLVIRDAPAQFEINSADAATDVAETVAAGDNWDSHEFVSMDTEFRIWRDTGIDFNMLVVAYVPTRASS
jgi:hypothetical protein